LALERRTYLFSTLLSFVFVIQLAALLLFVSTPTGCRHVRRRHVRGWHAQRQ
jgi:hypothetical protein